MEDAGAEFYNVKADLDTESPLLQDTALGDIVNDVMIDGETPADDPLKKFINTAANTELNPTEEDSRNALNAPANFGELAGATHGTYTNALLSANLAQDHLSIAHHEKEMHKDLWANYVHNRESVDGIELARMKANYEGSYNTFIIGSDLYAKDNLVLGVAGTYVTGKITSRNSTIRSKNDAKYYGASLYGRKINGKTAYLADISYLRGENDITQTNSGTVIKGKPKVNAISLGVKAEQKFETKHGSLIPYAGIRYMHLSQGTYKNNLGLTYDQEDQNLFLIPMGVKLVAEKEIKGWNVKPMAEVGVVINTGDKDTKQTVTYGEAENTVGYTVVNGTSLIGKLGVQAEKKNVTLGVSYQYQKSSDTSDNRFQLNVGYKF